MGERFVGIVAQNPLKCGDLLATVVPLKDGPFEACYDAASDELGMKCIPKEGWGAQAEGLSESVAATASAKLDRF